MKDPYIIKIHISHKKYKQVWNQQL